MGSPVEVNSDKMKLLALVLSVALVVKAEDSFVTRKDLVAKSSSQGSRIIAGEPAGPGQFPWQVAVYYRRPSGGLFFCGGSLVSDRFVLTAAHCADEASEFSLYLGGNRLNANEEGSLTIDLPGQAAIIHPFYNPANLNNDLALIELPEPVFFNERISPIRLPQPGEILQVGSQLSVSGWGITETSASIVNDLLFTFVHSISNLQCAAVYGSSVILDSTVCTQGSPVQSPCNGDSGGPLVSYDGPEPTLVGVVSFVHRDGCSSGQPAGYVRVEAQLQFISEILAEEPPPPENPEQPPPENPEEPPPPQDPEQPPPENPEEPPPPPPEDPEQPPPENPEEPPPPENPEQPPPENPEEPPPPENPEQPPPENPEQPPPENPEEPPPPENPEQPPPENPEEPPPQNPEDPELPPPENPEEPPPPENPEQPPPENPEQPPPENPEEPPPPENPEQPPPENPEEPPPPENPEEPPPQEQPPPEDPIPDFIMYKRI